MQVDLRQREAAGPVVLVAQLAAEGRVDGNAEAQPVVGRAEAGVEIKRRHDVVLQLALAAAAFGQVGAAGKRTIDAQLHAVAAHHGQRAGVVEHGGLVQRQAHAHAAHANVALPTQVYLKAPGRSRSGGRQQGAPGKE